MVKKQKCQNCGKTMLKKNMQRHFQTCKGVSQTKKKICHICSNIFSEKNFDRHMKNKHQRTKKVDKRQKKYKVCEKAQNLIRFFDPMPCYSEKNIIVNQINYFERKCLSQDDKDFLQFKNKFMITNQNIVTKPYVNKEFKHLIE